MKLTIEMLNDLNACPEGKDWFVASKCETVAGSCKNAMKEGHHDWANWLVARLLDRDDRIRYACYAARQELHIYENKCPGDMRSRNAIDAAEKCIDDKSDDARMAAWSAARAAWSAACSAERSAAWSAASAAWSAAGSAAWSAESAESAAWAESAARSAESSESAESAAWAESAARSAMMEKIINHGLSLLEGK